MSDISQDDLMNLGDNKNQAEEYRIQNEQYKKRQKDRGEDKQEKVDYDEMEYGDEFNDDEEARYRKENYGEVESEEEGESEQTPIQVIPLAKDFSKRANRG